MDRREEDERNCTGGWADAMDQLIENLRREVDFYKRRCDLLQAWQHRMRDPERTIVCDILANGQMLPDKSGERYGVHNAISQGREPLAAEVSRSNDVLDRGGKGD